MKYHMRRNELEISDPAVIESVLLKGKYATLALCRNSEPYAVTLNYGYDRSSRTLYFHCAAEGLKTDLVMANPNVCATIIQDNGYVQNECTHRYRSVVIRGKVEVLTEKSDKLSGINVLVSHLEDNPEVMRAKLTDKDLGNVRIWKLVIEETSAKEGK